MATMILRPAAALALALLAAGCASTGKGPLPDIPTDAMMPPGVDRAHTHFTVPTVKTGDVAPDFTLPAANGSENTSILLAGSYDFSLPGKALYASTMFKCKIPTANGRSSQFGFVTATNSGINDVAGQTFSTVILQSTAQPAPTYELRHQRRSSGGGMQESTLTGTATLVVSNWYKLSITYTNIRTDRIVPISRRLAGMDKRLSGAAGHPGAAPGAPWPGRPVTGPPRP